MKNLGTIIAAVVLAIVLVLYMCTFQVRFTEVAIIKTWGNPDKDAITEPGLRFKWPRPVQSVVIYDQRIRILEDRTEETRTVDGKNVLLSTFTLWKINDPARFHTNFPGGVKDGEKKLRATVVTTKQAVTGKHKFTDFISMDPKDRKIRQIEEQIEAIVAQNALQQFGIEVVDFGLKKLSLPQSVTSVIFESMRAHEEAKAGQYLAEGAATAAKIVADARAVERRIMAEAERKAAQIETEANRIVSEYYKEFDQHPELRTFLDTLRTYVEALRERTTLITTDREAPFNMFNKDARAAIPLQGRSPGSSTAERQSGDARATIPGKTD